jgi:predicted RNA-binding Zn ribbon-like protein
VTGQAVADPVVTTAGSNIDWDTTLVLDFLNTINEGAGADVLDEEAAWRAWVSARGLRHAESVSAARVVREGLRTSITAGRAPTGGVLLPDRFAGVAVVAVELVDGIPRLRGQGGLGSVLASAARLAIHGQWGRLKICPAADCQWAFFDRSRNRSRTWCSMRVCGNREKARAWRRRHA